MLKSAPEFGKPRGLASADSRLAVYGVAAAELRFLDSTKGTSVKSAKSSSGGLVSSPLLKAAICGPKLGVSLSPASPHSPNCLRRQGELPSGGPQTPPTLSLRGNGLEVLGGPPSGNRVRKYDFPSLVEPVADEKGFTSVTVVGGLSDPNCVRPSDVARGLI